MRHALAVVFALAASASVAHGVATPPQPFTDDFASGDMSQWDSSSNVHVHATDLRLLPGNAGGTFDGPVGRARKTLQGDWTALGEVSAAVEMGGLAWAVRNVTIRVRRDDNVLFYAKLTAWKDDREATDTRMRVLLGVVEANGTHSTKSRMLPDNLTSGTLKLEITDQAPDVRAEASLVGQPGTDPLLVTKAGKLEEVQVDFEADPALVASGIYVDDLSVQP